MSVEIRSGHALDLIGGIEPKSLELLATDPPYAFGGRGAEHALAATVAVVLREASYRLRPGGWAVIFSASSWRSTSYMIDATRGLLEPIRTGTWAKPKARSKVRTPGWAWASVNVLVLRRPGRRVSGKPSASLDYIVEEPLVNGRRAELPPAVASWAVGPFAEGGGRMLDPFAGSGALCRAASDAGMEALGFELSP